MSQSTKAKGTQNNDTAHWVETDTGYAVALVEGKLVARNAKGKQLASVPKKVKTTEQAVQLRELGGRLQERATFWSISVVRKAPHGARLRSRADLVAVLGRGHGNDLRDVFQVWLVVELARRTVKPAPIVEEA